jgi:uncharacterized membrane protein
MIPGREDDMETTPNTEKSSTGLEANLAGALTYVLGPLTGILFLVLDKDSKFVRFHAMQSTITFVAMFVISLVLGMIPILGWILLLPFQLAVLILWIFLMYKAFNREKFKLPVIGDLAEKQVG